MGGAVFSDATKADDPVAGVNFASSRRGPRQGIEEIREDRRHQVAGEVEDDRSHQDRERDPLDRLDPSLVAKESQARRAKLSSRLGSLAIPRQSWDAVGTSRI